MHIESYLGASLIYAAALTVIVLVLWNALTRMLGRPGPRGQTALALGLILFFLVLTEYPLPDPARMDCRDGGAVALWVPFQVLWFLWQHVQLVGPSGLFDNTILLATGFNYLLWVGIGLALARPLSQGRSPRRAWVLALGLATFCSLGAELTQLTAMFGLFPCPWRQFETTDLITNIGGGASGFALGRRWLSRRGKTG